MFDRILTTINRMPAAVGLASVLLLAGSGCNRSDANAAPKSGSVRTATPASPREERTVAESLFGTSARQVVVPEGVRIAVRLTSPLSSQTSYINDRVTGEVIEPVTVNGVNVIPSGSTVSGTVTAVSRLRRVGGQAQIAFELTRLTTPDGREYPIQLDYSRIGRNETPRDAATIAGGALAGVIIGQQLGHDRTGRVLGGLAGAGAGTAIASRTAGEKIYIPVGTTLRLTLLDAVRIEARS